MEIILDWEHESFDGPGLPTEIRQILFDIIQTKFVKKNSLLNGQGYRFYYTLDLNLLSEDEFNFIKDMSIVYNFTVK